MRYSRQRELVLNEVMNRCDHPTADAIFHAVKAQCPDISLGTVYRNLNNLVDSGYVRRVGVPGQPDHFDRTLEQHNHLFCTGCGCVQDISVNEEALKEVLNKSGEEWSSYNLTLYGVCSQCRKKVRLMKS